jgi:hypothetical protein
MSAGGATTGLLALSRSLQARRKPCISLVVLHSQSPDEPSLFLWRETPRRSATSVTFQPSGTTARAPSLRVRNAGLHDCESEGIDGKDGTRCAAGTCQSLAWRS